MQKYVVPENAKRLTHEKAESWQLFYAYIIQYSNATIKLVATFHWVGVYFSKYIQRFRKIAGPVLIEIKWNKAKEKYFFWKELES